MFPTIVLCSGIRDILDLLNTANATADHWRNFLAAAQRDNRFHHSGIRSPHQMVCEAVGAWVDSGFRSDGSEMPRDRTYGTWGSQLIFQRMEKLLDCFLTISEEGEFGFQANQHEKPKHLHGQLSIRIEPGGGFSFSPVLFNTNLPAEELAALAFFLFWQSPLLYTLMRCAKCCTYSIPRTVRKQYVRGWYCKQHQKSALAMAATKKARNDAHVSGSASQWKPGGNMKGSSESPVTLLNSSLRP